MIQEKKNKDNGKFEQKKADCNITKTFSKHCFHD